MQQRLLGKSNLRVSEISFGCMSLEKNETLNQQLVDRAIAAGINLFDTADLYNKGQNESMMGRLLKSKRQQVLIATKVGNQWRADGSGWEWNPRKDYILSAVHESLRRLQTDYIDLYQLHGGTIGDPIDETIEAFELLQQQGKIRYYGISSIRPNVIREYVQRSNIVSVMMQYSLLDRRPEESCLQLLEENNISVLARGSLAKGLLAGKPATDYPDHTAAEVTRAAAAVQQVANARGGTAAQAAIRYVLQHPAVATAVVGLRTAAQMDAVLLTPGIALLEEKEMRWLSDSVKACYYTQHR